MNVCVTGAGGFIGHHLARRLKKDGHYVRGVDIKVTWASPGDCDEFLLYDLRDQSRALAATRGMDWVFALAANMGGIGFISSAHAEIVADNSAITFNTVYTSRMNGMKRLLFASSACIYPLFLQETTDAPPLKEEDAYPAQPEGGYGVEKLYGEHLCKCYTEASWLDTCVARFHNVYGAEGSWNDTREKVPAAISRKIAVAKLTDQTEIEVWGDGQQRRSFMHVDDCVEGMIRLMQSGYSKPLNLGRDWSVTVSKLVDIISDIAGYPVHQRFDLSKPQGVRGRNSDNARCKEVLGWAPEIPLEEGLKSTYRWVEAQVESALEMDKALMNWGQLERSVIR